MSLGADVCDPGEFVARGPFDVVLELVGAPNFPANFEALALGGRIAIIGVGGGGDVALSLFSLMQKRASIRGSTLRARSLEEKAVVARLVEHHVVPLLASGRVTVPICETFAMADAAAAYERFEAGSKFGKIVLTT